MAAPIRILSSMATRQVLADLAAQCRGETGVELCIESVGGVDAARRVRSGEHFDAVILAANAIEQLIEADRVVAGSRVDLVRSGVAVAVRAGAPRPDLSSEAALRRAVLDARSLGYSTGPSGVALAALFERWGIAEQVRERIVQPPPGVPVGSLVASGEIALGFQQLSELIHLDGIDVIGPLPAPVQIVTVFSGGVVSTARHPDAVRDALRYLASPAADAAKRRHGMEPA